MKAVSILPFEKHVASLPISFVAWVCTYARVFFCVAKEGDELAFFIAGGLFVLTPLEKRPNVSVKVSKAPPPPKVPFLFFFQRTFEVTLVAEMCLNKQHRFCSF